MSLKNLFIAIISLFLILIVFVSSSFEWLDKFNLVKKDLGLKYVVSNTDNLEYLDSNDLETSYGFFGFSQLDSLLFENDKSFVDVTPVSENSFEIAINEGRYFFDIKDFTSKYTLKNPWFSIENISNWAFIVDYFWDNVKVYSFDSVLDFSLFDATSWVKSTSFRVYPHIFSKVDLKKNRFIKKSDLFRISQVNSIKYIPNISHEEKIINDEIFSIFDDNNSFSWFVDIIKKYHNYSLVDGELSYEYLKSINIWNVSWADLLKKYSNFFINEDKKKLFLKNLLLKRINSYFNDNSTFDESFENDFAYELETLKELSIKEYEDIILALEKHYYAVFSNTSSDFILKQKMSNLLKKTKKTSSFEDNNLYLNHIFSNYNSWNIGDNEFISLLNYFIENYLSKSDDIYDYRTVSFLIWEIIKNNIDMTWSDLSLFNALLSNYISLNSKILDKSNLIVKRTYLDNYISLVSEIENFIRTDFFEQQRLLESELLEIKPWKDKDKIKKLFSILFNEKWAIIPFIDSNLKTSRSAKNKLRFAMTKVLLLEYKQAFDDYEVYVQNYDKRILSILGVNSLFEWGEKITLSKQHFEDFIYSFRDANILDNYTFKIYNEHYRVENLSISWAFFSFDLYPFKSYLIDNISVWDDDDKFSWLSFRLLDEKQKYKNKYNDWELKFYDKFFENTFLNSEVEKEVVLLEEESKNTDFEPIAYREFKLIKLLWEKGDFSNLPDFIKIDYDDISLKETASWFDIILDDIDIWVKSWSWFSYKNFVWKFSWNYDIMGHFFVKPSIVFYEENTQSTKKFSWISINLNWNIPVNEIEKFIWILWENISNLNAFFLNVGDSQIKTWEITFDFWSKKFIMNLEINGSKYYFELTDKLDVAKKWQKNIISNSVEIPYIRNIKF